MFRYILRYKIDPEFHAEQRIAELLAYCLESRTQEVMLFFHAEELNPGHLTKEECLPYLDLAKRLKHILAQHGIDLSINPWTTLYQIARGRTLRTGQTFQPIIGETGFVNTVASCPLDPQWQNYLADLWAWIAKEVQPSALWVEDDWRLHNHDAESGWGGCFCPLHLQRFSERIGQSVTRQQVLQAFLAAGEPHPWRKLWLEVSKASLLEPAEKLYRAVAAAAPNVRLGLMSSVPDVHSAEGRDWPMLQNALRGAKPFLSRPHLPPYTETTALQAPPAVTRQTIACLARPIEIYPELESSPRLGVYSRSGSFAAWQCLNAAMYGSRGITINHFDMMGNGIGLNPTFAGFLAQAKPRLDALADLSLDDNKALGVDVLFKPQMGHYIHSTNAASMHGLCQDSIAWAKVLYTLGISHRYTTGIDNSRQPVAVSGQTLRACSPDEIHHLLSGVLFLDGCSVDILLERGYAESIGISAASWQELRNAAYAYERIENSDPKVYGLAYPRMTAQRCASELLAMKPLPAAQPFSTICRYDHKNLMPGCLYFENALGGKIISIAYPFDHRADLFMNFFSIFRRHFIQNILADIAPDKRWAAVTNHPANVYCIAAQEGLLLAAFNLIPDPADSITLRVQALKTPGEILSLSPGGQWERAQARVRVRQNDTEIQIHSRCSYLEPVFLLIKEN